jgi:hypothetical protein
MRSWNVSLFETWRVIKLRRPFWCRRPINFPLKRVICLRWKKMCETGVAWTQKIVRQKPLWGYLPLRVIDYTDVKTEKNLASREAILMPLDTSWPTLLDNPDHHHQETNSSAMGFICRYGFQAGVWNCQIRLQSLSSSPLPSYIFFSTFFLYSVFRLNKRCTYFFVNTVSLSRPWCWFIGSTCVVSKCNMKNWMVTFQWNSKRLYEEDCCELSDGGSAFVWSILATIDLILPGPWSPSIMLRRDAGLRLALKKKKRNKRQPVSFSSLSLFDLISLGARLYLPRVRFRSRCSLIKSPGSVFRF